MTCTFLRWRWEKQLTFQHAVYKGVGSRAGKVSTYSGLDYPQTVTNAIPVVFTYILCIADIVAEDSRREKEEGIIPDPDIDTYMKVILEKIYMSHLGSKKLTKEITRFL